MRTVACDKCNKPEIIKNQYNTPVGWVAINCTASIKDPKQKHGLARTFRHEFIFCPDCVPSMFDFDEADKTIEEQFLETTMDYLSDLAVDAVQAAQENI